MKHKYIGVLSMCIAGTILLQAIPVNAAGIELPEQSSKYKNTGTSSLNYFPGNVGTTLEGALDSKSQTKEEDHLLMSKAVGAAQLFESKKTDEEYIEAAQEAKGASWGYTNLGISNVDNNLNIRKEPSEDAGMVGKLPQNAACEVLKDEGEWSLIKSGDVEGYVKSEFLLKGWNAKKRAQESLSQYAIVSSDNLRVRDEPNTDSEVVTMVPKGEALEVVEVTDGWAKILIDSEEDFVSLEHVDIEEKLPTAMTMTELLYGQGVSDLRVSLSQYAKQFVGNPYVWGGTSLTKGADCSGFVMSVFKHFGISLPRTSQTQAGQGTRISISDAKPGDLIFYAKGGRINHVAIYIGGNQVVHASSPKTGIKVSNYNYRTPERIIRVLPNT